MPMMRPSVKTRKPKERSWVRKIERGFESVAGRPSPMMGSPCPPLARKGSRAPKSPIPNLLGPWSWRLAQNEVPLPGRATKDLCPRRPRRRKKSKRLLNRTPFLMLTWLRLRMTAEKCLSGPIIQMPLNVSAKSLCLGSTSSRTCPRTLIATFAAGLSFATPSIAVSQTGPKHRLPCRSRRSVSAHTWSRTTSWRTASGLVALRGTATLWSSGTF